MELVAIRPGFIEGRYIKTGEAFEFTGTRPPNWALPRNKAMPILAAAEKLRQVVDIKPAEAAEQALKKAHSYSNLR